MNKVVLISCVSKKLPQRAQAKDLYISPLFKMNLAFAHSLKPDKIFILSAKHGLVALQQEIDPYEQTLNTMSASEVERWAEKVVEQMRGKIDCKKDKIIFLAGEKYRRHLVPLFYDVSIPLQGMPIGKQLHYLKAKIDHAK